MQKTLFILRHEIYSLVSRWSFWLGLFGVPLFAFLVYGGVAWINHDQGADDSAASPISRQVSQLINPPVETRPQGYIDLAGLVRVYPAGFPKGDLLRFPDPAAAQRALRAGEISAYYVIPANYQQTGRLDVYMQDYNLVSADQRSRALVDLLNFNLLGGDERLARAVNQPLVDIREQNLSPEPEPAFSNNENPLSLFLPYAIMMLFFTSIVASASLMLNSLTKEKENRVLEILMISATPHQLLWGKITALALVGLSQVMLWAASGVALDRMSGQTFNLPPEFLLSPSILAWGAVFFLLGYLLYAILMAGVGALVPNVREASQISTLISIPLIVPAFLLSVVTSAPNGLLAIILSLIPFTAPTMMMMRLASASVPLWQLLLSILLLAAACLLIIRVVARLFRAQSLLAGQGFNLKRTLRALAGKA